MTPAAHDIEAIRKLGYSHTEAQFLYLAATYAGYFTRGQFLRFAGQTKQGCQVHRFTTKTLQYRHARAFEYGRHTYIFNLYSYRLYGAIDKDNLRPRRNLSSELVHIRLLILDFVLAHLDHEYLETDAQKVAHFHRSLGIPLSVLPGRIYSGLKSISNIKRYFVDRFPIFLTPDTISVSRSSVPTFVYCDPAESHLRGLTIYLRNYENLLRRLPAFNFIYASPTSAKVDRAAKFFDSTFGQTGPLVLRDITRYFQIRQLWESHQTNSLIRADRDLLRAGAERYHGDAFESAYVRWNAGTLSEAELDALLKAHNPTPNYSFSSWILPNNYAIFYRRSFSPIEPSPGSRFPIDG